MLSARAVCVASPHHSPGARLVTPVPWHPSGCSVAFATVASVLGPLVESAMQPWRILYMRTITQEARGQCLSCWPCSGCEEINVVLLAQVSQPLSHLSSLQQQTPCMLHSHFISWLYRTPDCPGSTSAACQGWPAAAFEYSWVVFFKGLLPPHTLSLRTGRRQPQEKESVDKELSLVSLG